MNNNPKGINQYTKGGAGNKSRKAKNAVARSFAARDKQGYGGLAKSVVASLKSQGKPAGFPGITRYKRAK